MLAILAEAAHEVHAEGIWDQYLSVIREPGHLLAEATYVVGELLILRIPFKIWLKRHDKKAHGV